MLTKYRHGVAQHSVAFEYLQVDMDGQQAGFLGGFCHTDGLVGLASLVSGAHACALSVLHGGSEDQGSLQLLRSTFNLCLYLFCQQPLTTG